MISSEGASVVASLDTLEMTVAVAVAVAVAVLAVDPFAVSIVDAVAVMAVDALAVAVTVWTTEAVEDNPGTLGSNGRLAFISFNGPFKPIRSVRNSSKRVLSARLISL
jgi:small ligand-binding sensory domain FIST